MIVWENWLRDLPEKAFFEIYRNYLGSVTTPYNKQDLIKRFTTWIKQEPVQQKIMEKIDDKESCFLSAIYFDKGEGLALSRNLIQDRDTRKSVLRNFQERLLLLQQEEGLYIINPILEPLLKEEGILSIARVVTSGDSKGALKDSFYPTDSFISAFLTYIHRNDRLMLNQGQLSKKFLDDFTSKFGNHIGLEPGDFLSAMLEVLLKSGLITAWDQGFRLSSPESLRSFQKGKPWQRRLLLIQWAAPSSRENWFPMVFDFLHALKMMEKKSWENILYIISENPDEKEKADWEIFRNRLTALGLIKKSGHNLKINQNWFSVEIQEIPPLVQPNGDISLTPETPFFWILPYTTELRAVGSFVQFHINKESFLKASPYRIRGDQWIQEMESYIQHPLEKMQHTLLQEWDKDIYSMEIQPAVLLKLSEDKKAWVKSSGVLERYCLGETQEGNWILSQDKKEQWLEALESIGIHYSTPYPDEKRTIQFPSMPSMESPRELTESQEQIEEPLSLDETAILKDYDELTLKELQSRIERKVILFAEQIRPELIRRELRQIRGFDFNGKVRLLEAALQPPAERLEIKFPSPEGIPVMVGLFPESLTGKGSTAILKGTSDEGEIIELPVSKILELKRFPLSLI